MTWCHARGGEESVTSVWSGVRHVTWCHARGGEESVTSVWSAANGRQSLSLSSPFEALHNQQSWEPSSSKQRTQKDFLGKWQLL